MASTTFVDKVTVIPTAWLNDVDALVYEAMQYNGSTIEIIKPMDVGDPGLEASGIDINGTTYATGLRVNDIGGTNAAQFVVHRHSTTLQPLMVGARSNSDDSSHAAVVAGQSVFTVFGSGYTGSHYDLFAAIDLQVDTGTVSATSSPGRILFSTAADGSNTLTERMRIDSDGLVNIVNTIALGGVSVTATAAELNYNDIALLGTSEASKVVTAGTNKAVILDNATAATTLTVAGAANYHAALFQGDTTSGQSRGVRIQAGVTSADWALYIGNRADTIDFFRVWGDGGILVGTPTGGNNGLGTINAVGVYDDNVLLTDYVYDLYLDNQINPEDEDQAKELLNNPSMLDLDKFTEFWQECRHLPSLPSREEFKRDRPSIGKLAQRLWETVELQSIHIHTLNERLKAGGL